MGKKIAVFPEPGAIGPVMNLVGICQGLKEMAQSLRMVAGAVGEVHAKFVRANFVTVAMSGLSDFFEPGGDQCAVTGRI